MPDGLYERDALAWAEQQADLLVRIAAGERLNEHVDWTHVIEEVRDVGLSELRSCRGLLRQAMVHLLKLQAWPGSQHASHWRGEVAGLLLDAQDRFTPSMHQRIVLDDLYAKAQYEVRIGEDTSGVPRKLPETCPISLDDLLSADPDIIDLVAKLTAT